MPITDQTFSGLAFPVATVRYSNGHYNATIRRDDKAFRARRSYDHAIGGGSRNALGAARDALTKLLADHNGLTHDGDYAAIPGDLNGDTYTFTFVPVGIFDRHATVTPDSFACAECGTTTAATYVVTTLDHEHPADTRTEVCSACHDAITAR